MGKALPLAWTQSKIPGSAVRRLISTSAVAALIVIVLAGCAAAPLTTSDVKVSLAVPVSANLVVGDTASLTSSVQVLHQRTDRVILQMETSSDGRSWTPLGTKVSKTGTFTTTDDLTLAAGTAHYRATVSSTGDKPQLLATSQSITLTVVDIKALIRTLYDNQTQAYQSSTAAGTAFDLAHEYPGEFDAANPVWANNVAYLAQAGYRHSAVPDLTTISPTPTWTIPGSTCNPAGVAPPKGRTFALTINVTDQYTNYPARSSKVNVHVTLLTGKLYFYEPFCAPGLHS